MDNENVNFDALLDDDADLHVDDQSEDFEPLTADSLLEDPKEPKQEDPSKKQNDVPPTNLEEENDKDNNEEDEDEEGDTNTHTDNSPEFKDNAIYQFLQSYGVKDPSKIQFTNEDDSIEEVDFNSLSTEEQLDLLKTIADPGLTEEEIEAINYLRKNNTTLKQTVDYFAQKYLEDYLTEHPEDKKQKQYSIDEYSDDDLFLVDLKKRYPDFTEEELLSELESAKTNEELFKKKAEILRNTYKEQEDQAEAQRLAEEQQQAEDLRNNLTNAVSQFNEIQLDYTDDTSDTLVIEDSDKQEMMAYILDQDDNGQSQLVRDLADPNVLIEMAWYMTQGPKVMSELTKYWKGLLSEARAENKKLLKKIEKEDKHKTVITKTEPKNSNRSAWDDFI